ncbi:MAG: hypothetical protein LV479_06030 [Methylacidiphilales bacterium]|nr:hypothetical protein [Candidatus Methylacidiphilales bacterium]
MNRFSKFLGLLVLALFLIASGVDATLDHLAHSATQSSCTWYDGRGEIIAAYNGDLALYKADAKPNSVPHFFHRTAGHVSLSSSGSAADRWF